MASENINPSTIESRDDLSFTARDERGLLQNWSVPHDQNGNWHTGVEIGYLHFSEVAELAAYSETEAYNAIRFAMNAPGWRTYGWGIECGYSEALARAAIIGLRVLREGKEQPFKPYDTE